MGTRSLPALLERLSRAIARHSQRACERSSSLLARRAARLLDGVEVRVERVEERLGVSARHLRRAFTESIGIGPKDFARSVRLQRAIRMATSSQDWVGIASAVGYYDQAHLIADFRELVGLTPTAYLKWVRQAAASSAGCPQRRRREPGLARDTGRDSLDSAMRPPRSHLENVETWA